MVEAIVGPSLSEKLPYFVTLILKMFHKWESQCGKSSAANPFKNLQYSNGDGNGNS
ncbi:hypothetical protein ACTXT7_014757 [Hymenolepis weldensis]